jgi:hypothetical protein
MELYKAIQLLYKTAPHSFLFFQVLPHLLVNGTAIVNSIIQAKKVGIILNTSLAFTPGWKTG